MNSMKKALLIGLSVALPLSLQSVCLADTLNVESSTTEADVAAQVHAAKDRLETAKVRLEIAKKQVVASKARLKAAESEYKAAQANSEARNLQHEAFKLSESSGLPAITNTQIEESKQRSLASRFLKKPAAGEEVVTPEVAPEAPAVTPAAPVDLSNTRIQQVDFNAPGYEKPAQESSVPSVPHSSYVPSQKLSTGNDMGTGLVANSPSLEQPPIVP
ncbi:MAG: hypothetical protein R3C24_03535 [Cyanobacteriota/Melainabacteria group bacterium]|nr:hypothetical protein [Cyanobacteria bacterium HKST-UBA01]